MASCQKIFYYKELERQRALGPQKITMIHKYKLRNTNFVIDGNSGAIHIVDNVTYDILDYLDGIFFDYTEDYVVKKLENKYKESDIRDAFGSILNMNKSGKLFSEDIHENLATEKNLNSPIKAICLNVAHDCNLQCSYCFAAKGDFGCGRELMSLQTAKNAVDFVIKMSGNIHNLEMDFFGGEPLMNFGVVKETVKYARSLEKKYNKKFRFTITTNGLLLDDEKIDFINSEMFDVVLSLDGRKKINDKHRITRSGMGSYDVVVPKFQKLVAKRGDKSYYVRGTYTKDNLEFSNDVIHINDLGFERISMEPALCGDSFSESVTDDCIEKVLFEHEVLCNKLIDLKNSGKKIDFFNFDVDINKGPCILKRLKGCGCGNDYIAVTPNGDIYSCHQVVGEKKFKMGNVNDGVFLEETKKPFLNMTIYHKEKCRDCWAKFYCSGGCAAKNHFNCGDIMHPYDLACKMQQKKIECAVAYQYFTANTSNIPKTP